MTGCSPSADGFGAKEIYSKYQADTYRQEAGTFRLPCKNLHQQNKNIQGLYLKICPPNMKKMFLQPDIMQKHSKKSSMGTYLLVHKGKPKTFRCLQP